VNLLEVITDNATVYACSVNGIAMEEKFLTGKKRGNRLLTHYISGNDSTILNLTLSKDDRPELTFFEVSRDLLSNSRSMFHQDRQMPFHIHSSLTML
jgi:hypothetical protein